MKPVLSRPLRLADLPQRNATPVRLVPDEGELEALADRLDLDGLRKVKMEGTLRPEGADWLLEAMLGATMVQPCRVTTDPVTTRVDEVIRRRYTADPPAPEGDETAMPEDDTVEPLPAVLDVGAVLEEALSLAVPAYPRAAGAEEIDLAAAPPGAAPLDDDAVRPFAGLAALRARMDGADEG